MRVRILRRFPWVNFATKTKEQQLEEMRLAQLHRELAMSRQIRRIYSAATNELGRRAAALGRQIARARKAGEIVNPSWLYSFGRLNALKLQMEERMEQAGMKAAEVVEKAKKAAARQGVKDSTKLMSATIEGSFQRLPVEALDFLAARMKDGTALAERLQREGREGARDAEDALFSGAAAGDNPREMKAAVQKALKTSSLNAEVIARNETIGAHRDAALSNYNQNADILDGWIWMATHDRRTCAACLAMDGKKFRLSEPFASHPMCRCTPVPSLKGEDVWNEPTGQDWLLGQPLSVRKDILGVRGAALVSQGVLQLDDFVQETASATWGPGRRVKSYRQMVREGTLSPAQLIAAAPKK